MQVQVQVHCKFIIAMQVHHCKFIAFANYTCKLHLQVTPASYNCNCNSLQKFIAALQVHHCKDHCKFIAIATCKFRKAKTKYASLLPVTAQKWDQLVPIPIKSCDCNTQKAVTL